VESALNAVRTFDHAKISNTLHNIRTDVARLATSGNEVQQEIIERVALDILRIGEQHDISDRRIDRYMQIALHIFPVDEDTDKENAYYDNSDLESDESDYEFDE
jgi:hypothetical protein